MRTIIRSQYGAVQNSRDGDPSPSLLYALQPYGWRPNTIKNKREIRLALDAYFSADVETDGPIPGPYSLLSFALVYAGSFDGTKFTRPNNFEHVFYRELRPISTEYQQEALNINGLDRARLEVFGSEPVDAMSEAADWIKKAAHPMTPVLVAYPLSFDWTWLYWYFVRFSRTGSPFDYSRCFDIKTAVAVKSHLPISASGRSRLPPLLRSHRDHTHHAIDDAIEQAEVFANVFEWDGANGLLAEAAHRNKQATG